MRRCSLLGAEFVPVELQAHAPNNARVRYIIILILDLSVSLSVTGRSTEAIWPTAKKFSFSA